MLHAHLFTLAFVACAFSILFRKSLLIPMSLNVSLTFVGGNSKVSVYELGVCSMLSFHIVRQKDLISFFIYGHPGLLGTIS